MIWKGDFYMRTIKFRCPKCEKMLEISEQLQGREGACPECHSVISIPFLIDKSNDSGSEEVENTPVNEGEVLEASESELWFIRTEDYSELGPYTAEELIRRMLRGEFPPSALAKKENSDEWLAITEYQELISVQAKRASSTRSQSYFPPTDSFPQSLNRPHYESSPKKTIGGKEIAFIIITVVLVFGILIRDKLPSGREFLQLVYLMPADPPKQSNPSTSSTQVPPSPQIQPGAQNESIDIEEAAEIIRQNLSSQMQSIYSNTGGGLPKLADYIFFDRGSCQLSRYEIHNNGSQVIIDMEFMSTQPQMLEIISKGIGQNVSVLRRSVSSTWEVRFDKLILIYVSTPSEMY